MAYKILSSPAGCSPLPQAHLHDHPLQMTHAFYSVTSLVRGIHVLAATGIMLGSWQQVLP